MKVIHGLENIESPFKNAVVAVGNFDGVHLGHQAIFAMVRKKASEINGTSVAITFDPHPVKVLNHREPPPLITLLRQKLELIEKQGIDVTICIAFNSDFASLSASTFVEDILVGKIGMKGIVIGKDYVFGKNRQGNVDYLKSNSQRLGFEVIVPDWVAMNDSFLERVSSTRIREIIQHGEVGYAKQFLGRYYQLRGTVSPGRRRGGRQLGFPTANIQLEDELCPRQGVYAVTVELEQGTYMGVANIGYSPTFDDYIFTVEVHIIDFEGDLYGKRIRVNFISRIRDEIKFNSIDELADQIHKDVETGRHILSGLT
jgi:riboflavin kinase / FMN adenylyltransferase